MAVLANSGVEAIGYDRNPKTVALINDRIAPVAEPGLQELIESAPFFTATINPAAAEMCDYVFIVVPTPSTKQSRRFSNRYVLEAIDAVGPHLQPDTVVVVNSTVMPGSMSGVIRQSLRDSTHHDEELGLCYNPEFIALGEVIDGIRHPSFVLIGAEQQWAADRLTDLTRKFVSPVTTPVKIMSSIDAEITKLALNNYVTMKISFANAIGELCDRNYGADAETVLNAVGLDFRVGQPYLRPATAYGGPCFPRDVRAFQALVDDDHILGAFARATESVNDHQTERMITKLLATGKRTFAVLGVSYKPGTAVDDESPGLHLAARLVEQGMTVFVHEPALGHENPCDLIRQADVVVVMTPDQRFRGIEEFGEKRLLLDPWRIIKGDQWDRIPWGGTA